MSEEESLRKHAENYRRLAESVSSEATRKVLLDMARDYQARADRLASDNAASPPPKD